MYTLHKRLRLKLDKMPKALQKPFKKNILSILNREHNQLVANCKFNSDKLFLYYHSQIESAIYIVDGIRFNEEIFDFYDNSKLINSIVKNTTEYVVKRLK